MIPDDLRDFRAEPDAFRILDDTTALLCLFAVALLAFVLLHFA